jgi:hypothetical protein
VVAVIKPAATIPVFARAAMEDAGNDDATVAMKRLMGKRAEHHVKALLGVDAVLLRDDYDPNGTPDAGHDIVYRHARKTYRIDVKWVPQESRYVAHAGANFNFDVVVVVVGPDFQIAGAALPDQFRPAVESNGLCPTGRFVWLHDLTGFPSDWPIERTGEWANRVVLTTRPCGWSVEDGVWSCSTHPNERWNAEAMQIETVDG